MNSLAAIPEQFVLESPELARDEARLLRQHGYSVLCVVDHHYPEAHAVLGSRVEYVAPEAWLDNAVWVMR